MTFHAATIGQTAAGQLSRSRQAPEEREGEIAAATWERHSHHIRPLVDGADVLGTRIAGGDEEADAFAVARLVVGERSPDLGGVVPVVSVFVGRSALAIQSVPVLCAAGRVPAAVDVDDHPQRVLQRPVPARRNDVGPSAWTVLLREV